jgi:hypothetical protein
MKTYIFSLALLALALPLAGCGSSNSPVAEEKPYAARLGDSIDLSLADLLSKPRAQLAEMADECAKGIQIQEKSRREGQLAFHLLPDLRLPLAVPVFRQARYSATVEFSLPPYLKEGTKDSVLALHLARYGDHEAAGKLVEPGDAQTKRQIEAARYEREYPVEWTRLVGLLLHAAQMRLATGDIEGGTEVVVLHRQLRSVLDAKAARGPLGAVLLSRGRLALTRAAAAWRAEKKSELAGQAEAVLAEWGDVPAMTLPHQTGAPRAELSRLLDPKKGTVPLRREGQSPFSDQLRSAGKGRVLAASSITRAFDLLALPFPDEGAEAVLAFFDDSDRLADLWITYRSRFSELFPAPAQLAQLVEEQSVKPTDCNPGAYGMFSRIYRIGDVSCTVSVVSHGAGVGALVRLGQPTDRNPWAVLPRDFRGANLDRSFEQNRFCLTPEQRGDKRLNIRGKALTQLRNPLPALQLAGAELRREPGHNLAAALVLRYAVSDTGPPPLAKLASPLWTALGPGQVQGVADKNGGHLALTWEDTRTQYTLRLPYETSQPVEMEISDRQGREHLAEREAAARAFDCRERQQRLKAGKPIQRIARNLEQIELGMTRGQVLQVLPPGRSVLKRDIPGGLTVTFTGEATPSDSYLVRQMFIRFDAGRVVELRARYVDGPALPRFANRGLKRITKRAGAPTEGPSPWATVWSDLPPQKPAPLLYRWQDDKRMLVYQSDAGGFELALRDCRADPELGKPLSPLDYLPRGPAKLQLGLTRQEILQQWGIKQPVYQDGVLVLQPAQPTPFDTFLVWFKGDRAVQIIARHVLTTTSHANAANWSQALSDAWGRDLATLGWPRRQDFVANGMLQSLGWHDDRTRIRIFWQEPDNTGPPRVYTEWKDLSG